MKPPTYPVRRAHGLHLGSIIRYPDAHVSMRHGVYCISGWNKQGVLVAEGFRNLKQLNAYIKAHIQTKDK